MKYTPPAGGAPNDPYLDGNRSAAVRGSIPPAAAIEHDQREIVAVIEAAGLTPDAGNLTQLLQAINALIAAANGGAPAGYILMSQARARLPIFPETQTASGKIAVTASGGNVLVPAGVSFLHRGIFPVSTDDYSAPARTLPHSASKTYHLRWDPTNGFRLRDLADGAYNGSVAAESNQIFDSTFDDMLISRVVTDSLNNPTVTNLINKDRFRTSIERPATELIGAPGSQKVDLYTFDLARTPTISLARFSENTTANGDDGIETAVFVTNPTRYGASVNCYSIGQGSNKAYAPIYKCNVVMN